MSMDWLVKSFCRRRSTAVIVLSVVLVSCPIAAQSQTLIQQGTQLVGAGAAGPAEQGYFVSLSADGNTALVGGPLDGYTALATDPGAVWAFTRSGGVWTQQGAKFGLGGAVSLAADGNTALVG